MTKPGTLPAAQPSCFHCLQEYHLLFSTFPGEFGRRSSGSHMLRRTLHLPALTGRDSVWANPLSLAANNGISIDFSSSWYSDVSFPRVCAPLARSTRTPCGNSGGFDSIRESPDQRLHASTRSLSQLATPFFATQAKPFTIQRQCFG